MINKLPKIKIDSCKLSDNSYISPDNITYDVPTLIQYCKDNNYKEFDLPLAGINLSTMPWTINTIHDFIYHSNRVNLTDQKHPIILDDSGTIADGWHRIVKAILSGKTTIKAIRMSDMPRGHKDE